MPRRLLRFALAAIALGAGCHSLLLWRRHAHYESIHFQEPLASIVQKLGAPAERIPCTEGLPAMLPDADGFCVQTGVAEVAIFRACALPGLCPTVLVALDKEARMMFKSRPRA